MKLVKINDNTYINPLNIQYVEGKENKGQRRFVVTVNGREFTISNVEDFLKQVADAGNEDNKQFFAL